VWRVQNQLLPGRTSLSLHAREERARFALDKKGTIPALRLFLSWRNGGGARDLITAAAAPDVSRCPAHINSLPFVLCVLRKREKRKFSAAFHHPHKNFIAECVLRQLI
jgi:hypothetical protein